MLYSASARRPVRRMAHESGPVLGWPVATFVAPISISPSTTYVAGLYFRSSEYMQDYTAQSQPGLGGFVKVREKKIILRIEF
jgi:hypothetical protein